MSQDEHNYAIYKGWEYVVNLAGHVLTRQLEYPDGLWYSIPNINIKRAAAVWVKSYRTSIPLQTFLDGTGL